MQQQDGKPRNSGSDQDANLRYRSTPPNPREQRLVAFSLLLFGFVIALIGLVGGFIYGDSYGRKHAQYDNPQLREYYAGQCYNFWESQFKKTVRSSLEKTSESQLQNTRLEEIQSLLQDLQRDLTDFATHKSDSKPSRKKAINTTMLR